VKWWAERKLTSRETCRKPERNMCMVSWNLKVETTFPRNSHLDTECFQEFLNDFSETYPEDLHIIQLDNGSFHTTPKLKINPSSNHSAAQSLIP